MFENIIEKVIHGKPDNIVDTIYSKVINMRGIRNIIGIILLNLKIKVKTRQKISASNIINKIDIKNKFFVSSKI